MGCKDSKENDQIINQENRQKQEILGAKMQNKIQENEQIVSIANQSMSNNLKIQNNRSKEIRQRQEERGHLINKAYFSDINEVYKMERNRLDVNTDRKQIIEKSQEQLQKTECMICLDKPSNIKTRCNHLFCKDCIQGSVKRYNFCPYCRAFDPLASTKEKQTMITPSQKEWNIEIARKVLFREQGENGMRRIYLKDLDNGKEEQTNIYVGKTAKIYCSPSANIFIHGQKVNPNECNQQ